MAAALSDADRDRLALGRILLIIGTATGMAWALTQSGFSRQLAATMAGVPGGGAGFLAISIVAFAILGSVLEGIPAIVLFGPLLFPVARALHIHDVHYAMVVILAMGLGLFAPPFGVGFYAACAIGRSLARRSDGADLALPRGAAGRARGGRGGAVAVDRVFVRADGAAVVGAELARPRRPQAARGTMAGLTAGGAEHSALTSAAPSRPMPRRIETIGRRNFHRRRDPGKLPLRTSDGSPAVEGRAEAWEGSMTTISLFAAAGLCAATLLASAGVRAPAPVRLVGENCPLVAPAGARIERDIAAVDEIAAAPRNVCLVFFEAEPDELEGMTR